MGNQDIAIKINDFRKREVALEKIFAEKDDMLIDLYAVVKVIKNCEDESIFGYNAKYKAGDVYILCGGERLKNKEDYMTELLPKSKSLRRAIIKNSELVYNGVDVLYNQCGVKTFYQDKMHKSENVLSFCGTSGKGNIEKLLNYKIINEVNLVTKEITSDKMQNNVTPLANEYKNEYKKHLENKNNNKTNIRDKIEKCKEKVNSMKNVKNEQDKSNTIKR